MRTIAIVYLLSDIYGLETEIEPEKLEGVREFRNRLMQFRALARREAGTHIAQILLFSCGLLAPHPIQAWRTGALTAR